MAKGLSNQVNGCPMEELKSTLKKSMRPSLGMGQLSSSALLATEGEYLPNDTRG
jgi:hypothetical protein